MPPVACREAYDTVITAATIPGVTQQITELGDLCALSAQQFVQCYLNMLKPPLTQNGFAAIIA